MGEVILAPPAAQPVSLYIALEEGRIADLEVVSRASLEFVAGLRELAFLIDPSLEIRVEIENGEEGSLRLNAWLRQVRATAQQQTQQIPSLKTIVAAAGLWFLAQTGTYTYEKVLDHLLASKDPQIAKLAPQQVEEIAQRVAKLLQSKSVRQHAQGVYRELDRDPVIQGVGLATDHSSPPRFIVPKSEFYQRALAAPELPSFEIGERRTQVEREGVYTIIKPVLKEGGGKWRLSGQHGEFSASITDQRFLDDVMTGETHVPLAAEIHITADLETVSEHTAEGAWKPITHRILRVWHIERQPTQGRLFSSGEQQERSAPEEDQAGERPS